MASPDHIEANGYRIEDPRPIREASPFSFYIPCQERLDAISGGDFVKAIFAYTTPGGLTERMWIRVDETDGDELRGVLLNQPSTGLPIAPGAPVAIKRHHVITIETERADDPVETNDNDRFFARCHVDPLFDQGEPLHRIVRDEPEPLDYHGKGGFPWSGWRFESKDFKKGDALETYALVVPLRRETGYENLLDAPMGSVIERIDGVWSITGPKN